MFELARNGIDPNRIQIARLLGISSSVIYRWRRDGVGVDMFMADRLACRLGFHPSLIWGDAWWEATTVDMSPCATSPNESVSVGH